MILLLLIPLLIALLLQIALQTPGAHITFAFIHGIMFGISTAKQEDENGDFRHTQIGLGCFLITLYTENNYDR